MHLGPGTVVDDRFQIVRFAGKGGMGTVFQTRDRASGELVALKVLRGESGERERFDREIALLATVVHPNIVRLLTHGTLPDDVPYFVMEWVDGERLDDLLEERGITVAQAVALAATLARALGAIHDAGLVHRDLKPSNIMLANGELHRVKLIDFGIARPVREESWLTNTGMVVGTPGFMSPEQARGQRQLDSRADVFSLGCVLYECITGWSAFAGEHSLAVRTKIVLGTPPPIGDRVPEAPPELVALVERMLEKHPDDRPRDGHAVADALAALPAVGPGPARRVIDNEPRTLALRTPSAYDFLVMVGPRFHPGGAAKIALPELARAIRELDPMLELTELEDSALVVRVPGRDAPKAAAALAVRCARLCGTSLPVAICAVTPNAPLGVAIDHAAAAMSQAALRPSSPVWTDSVTRELLGALAP